VDAGTQGIQTHKQSKPNPEIADLLRLPKPNQKEKLLQYIIEIFPRIQRLAKVLSKENNEIRNGRGKNHNNSPLKRLKLLL